MKKNVLNFILVRFESLRWIFSWIFAPPRALPHWTCCAAYARGGGGTRGPVHFRPGAPAGTRPREHPGRFVPARRSLARSETFCCTHTHILFRGAYQWGTPPSHLDLVFGDQNIPGV